MLHQLRRYIAAVVDDEVRAVIQGNLDMAAVGFHILPLDGKD
jgi:hypothetical protein